MTYIFIYLLISILKLENGKKFRFILKLVNKLIIIKSGYFSRVRVASPCQSRLTVSKPPHRVKAASPCQSRLTVSKSTRIDLYKKFIYKYYS